MLYQHNDVLYLSNPQALDLFLGHIYHHKALKGLFTKTHLNWWQQFPNHFHATWGIQASGTKSETIQPCLFIVESTYRQDDFILLLNYQALANHPDLDKEALKATRNQEIYLLNILRHHFKERKNPHHAICAHVSAKQLAQFKPQLKANGNLDHTRYLVWKQQYDEWFNWNVEIDFRSKKNIEPRITAELVRDDHCYKDKQGLQIMLRHHYQGNQHTEIATIQIHQRANEESFDNPVIQNSSNLADWQISATIKPDSRRIHLEIREAIQ